MTNVPFPVTMPFTHRIKQQRDELAHGAAFDESQLPMSELNDRLLKYLAAHATAHP